MEVPQKHYETEEELETTFVELLQAQGYEYVAFPSEKELFDNLKQKLEALNGIRFSLSEWESFLQEHIINPNLTKEDKTHTIQKDYIKVFTRDDGTKKNIKLLDKEDVLKNSLQVMRQYTQHAGGRRTRYDVTILVNGFPLVHMELKRRGVALKEAFRQIDRYQDESFWGSSGIFEFVQIFVISNGTHTKYYSNTARSLFLKSNRIANVFGKKEGSSSFEFTMWWLKEDNSPVYDLVDFTKTFFEKQTILEILTKYCVFTVDKKLLVMRPYQIVATKRILEKINMSYKYGWYGTKKAGGYIWHTTGSGKTLTSFKVAQLATNLPYIDKVLFVVDRKDLDYQTMREYDQFEKGAANSNTSTRILEKQLRDENARIIITTIQKLHRFIGMYENKKEKHPVFEKHIVIIFDECHRSQFGEMHKAIIKHFKNYYLFGFTGTPIFEKNACNTLTTSDLFGDCLHSYTVVHAIRDGSVLPFLFDSVSTMKIPPEEASEELYKDPKRIEKIVAYILQTFDRKTKRDTSYSYKEKRMRGFNALFAVASIELAMLYYNEFKKQLETCEESKKLRIATIFSYTTGEQSLDGTQDENVENTDNLDQNAKQFLEKAIEDYNAMFGTSYDTSPEKFQNYYKDVSKRVKDNEIDLLIVVNMFLTGFDAVTLNTLWVDKNLRFHGLIQAFSRTNRIFNSVKSFGNIVSFRDLEKELNEALELFGGDESVRNIVFLKTFEKLFYGYEEDGKYQPGYKDLIETIQKKFPLNKKDIGLLDERSKKEFIDLWGKTLKLRNILTSFDEFEEKDPIDAKDFQNYQSTYLDLYEQSKTEKAAKTEKKPSEDVVFEIELVKQIEVNIDYILMIIKKTYTTYMSQYSQQERSAFVESLKNEIGRWVLSSLSLRNKKDIIEDFIAHLSLDMIDTIENEWKKFLEERKKQELDALIEREKLQKEPTYHFLKKCFDEGDIRDIGTDFGKILPKGLSLFHPNFQNKKKEIFQKLQQFFERYYDVSSREKQEMQT